MNLLKREAIHVAPPFNKLILGYEYLFRNIRCFFRFFIFMVKMSKNACPKANAFFLNLFIVLT